MVRDGGGFTRAQLVGSDREVERSTRSARHRDEVQQGIGDPPIASRTVAAFLEGHRWENFRRREVPPHHVDVRCRGRPSRVTRIRRVNRRLAPGRKGPGPRPRFIILAAVPMVTHVPGERAIPGTRSSQRPSSDVPSRSSYPSLEHVGARPRGTRCVFRLREAIGPAGMKITAGHCIAPIIEPGRGLVAAAASHRASTEISASAPRLPPRMVL